MHQFWHRKFDLKKMVSFLLAINFKQMILVHALIAFSPNLSINIRNTKNVHNKFYDKTHNIFASIVHDRVKNGNLQKKMILFIVSYRIGFFLMNI